MFSNKQIEALLSIATQAIKYNSSCSNTVVSYSSLPLPLPSFELFLKQASLLLKVGSLKTFLTMTELGSG